jgi:hypothetical protein
MERFTRDPLNGPHAGEVRDARIEFWGDARGLADVLEPTAAGVRVLAHVEDYFRRPQGACLTAFENPLGGRVVVMGYAPWMFLGSTPKRTQLLNAADWLARGTLPVRVEETVPLAVFARFSKDRTRGLVVLLNTGLEPVERATVSLRVPQGPVCLATPQGTTELPLSGEAGARAVTLRDLPPWGTACLLVGAKR